MVNPNQLPPSNLTTGLFPFQEKASHDLLDLVSDPTSKQTIVVKAPTGSGKTVILIDFIDEYLTNISGNTAFIWLCPGDGDLEEQSRDKMKRFAPHRVTYSLFEALNCGFNRGTTTFINWELVTNNKNRALKDNERKNLKECITQAHRNNIDFNIIIDEEHSHDTYKAGAIIDLFSAKHIIRVSATANQNKQYEHMEINESDVIDAGLITRAIYVNEGVTEGMEIDTDYDCLLDLADEKRKAIAARYKELGKDIRPLVLIQFPNGHPETIAGVEKKLANMGYTYDNGMVSIWMSENKKDLPPDLTENNGPPVFLLFKQAISTGWDCPRAKILVKLREDMSDTFEIQTIGRIRRMPEGMHYNDNLLDYSYLYTFDEKYEASLFNEEDKAYEVHRLFLKDKCKTFSLTKQTRDLDFDGMGERETLNKIYDSLVSKYHLTNNKKNNELLLEEAGYKLGDTLVTNVLHGEYVHMDQIAESTDYLTAYQRVNTSTHGLQLLHCIDTMKSILGLPTTKVRTILERLFRDGKKSRKKLLRLSTNEFYAFIINNVGRLRQEFRDIAADLPSQESFPTPKTSTFYIPEQDFYHYDPEVKNEVEYLSNAYKEYTSGYATTRVRSTCEVLFEQYCERQDDIDWVYKNGDSGQQYFSIVYVDALYHQSLFYADYIIKKKDGTVWIIETKGGEANGHDKNIDQQVQNKFIAFKSYAEDKDFCWGFVRDKDNILYIDNTVYEKDLADDHWVPLEDEF